MSETIKYANKCGFRFLVYNGRHGSLTTLGQLNGDGIAIFMNKFDSVSLGPNTATIGGGINSKVLIDTLWAANRQIVSGTCECVSVSSMPFFRVKPLLSKGSLVSRPCSWWWPWLVAGPLRSHW